MHIEKNMFENIFNAVMDVKGKTKDNIKARLDIALYCNRKNMELVYDESRVTKPRASFVLEKNAQLLVYKWLKSLHFPDGHASKHIIGSSSKLNVEHIERLQTNIIETL